MKAIKGAIYCKDCTSSLLWGAKVELALRFPASHDEEEKGTCRDCGKEIRLCEASKVVRREEK